MIHKLRFMNSLIKLRRLKYRKGLKLCRKISISSDEINKHFRTIIDLLKLNYDPNIEKVIYSSKVKHINAYAGYFRCGPVSYTLSYFVKKIYPHLVLFPGYASFGYGEYVEDHICILTYNASKLVIIDPTYKQFLDSTYCDGTSYYSSYLYKVLPPFFVGTKDELEKIIDDLIKLEIKIFNKHSINKDDVMNWWMFRNNSSHKFDLYERVYDKSKDPDELNKAINGFGKMIKYLRNHQL